jgi:hypothetical protein
MKHQKGVPSPPRHHATTPPRQLIGILPVMIFLQFWLLPRNSEAQCFAQESSGTSDIPAAAFRPFCDRSGFSATVVVDHDESCSADLYIIVEARPKGNGVNTLFRGDVAIPPDRYFSNIVSSPAAGAPTLTEVHTLEASSSMAKLFRFRVSLPDVVGSTAFTLPFAFAPNFFFGDVPWRVWFVAKQPAPNGDPVLPTIPPSSGTEILLGTLLFTSPYYPIVGTKNVADVYDEMTGYWADPNPGRAHSVMLLPDGTGALPTLNVDVQELRMGHMNGSGTIRTELIMWPGAQVKVLDGKHLNMAFTDMFTCVGEVSRGISVEPGGQLTATMSNLNDSETAVSLKRGSRLTTQGFVTFVNNYKGVRVDNTPLGSYGNISAFFGTSNTFRNTAPLKSPYTGMSNPTCTRGYGLEIINHPGISLGGGWFDNLNNGVRLVRSTFSHNNGLYSGIRKDAGSSVAHQGYAVWGLGSGTEALTFFNNQISPFGASGPTDKSVYLQNMSLNAIFSAFESDEGVYLQNCKFQRVVIRDCNNLSRSFQNRFFGVRSSNCLPLAEGSKVDNNFFLMSNPGNTGPNGAAILLGEGAAVITPGASSWKLTNNFIDLGAGTPRGIRALGVNKAELRKNDVELLSPLTQDQVGIDVATSANILANCNKVHTVLLESQATGYRFTNVGQSDYTCNENVKTNKGIEFSVLCEGTTIKGSELVNTPTGLLLRGDVTLGPQGLDIMGQPPVQDHGNKWANSWALHDAVFPQIVVLSRFGVDPPEDPGFLPPNNWGNTWFWTEITPVVPTFSCGGFSCSGQYSTPPKDRSVERSVADGSIGTVGLPGVLPRMLENRLYAELKKGPAWANGDPVYYSFMQGKTGTVTEAFWQLQQGMDMLDNRTSGEQSAVSALEAPISAHRQALYLMDSAYASGTEINMSLYAQRLEALSAAEDNLRGLLETMRSNRLALAAQLLAENSAIGATQNWELAEKTLRALEIQLFVQDSVSAQQLAILDSMGTLCPYQFGDAVFRAQVLYNRYEEKVFSPVCAEERVSARNMLAENAVQDALKLYPNPTTGWVTIPNPTGTPRDIRVFDAFGQQVHQLISPDAQIDLTSLNSGVFFLKISDKYAGKSDSIRLIITK